MPCHRPAGVERQPILEFLPGKSPARPLRRFHNHRIANLFVVQKGRREIFDYIYDEIPDKDWPIIQHKEGAVTGMCIEREVAVRVEGRGLKATAFTTRPERATLEGPVSARFVEALVRGAKAAGLPDSYVQRIRAGSS